MARKQPSSANQKDLTRQFKEAMARTQALSNPPFAKLFAAAGDGRLAQVRKYIEQQGFDVDTRNFGGYTPLGYAVSDGSAAVVDYLIGKGADVNARTNEGLTPLSMAAAKNNATMFRLLLEAGANPRTRTNEGLTVRKLAEFNSAAAVLEVLDDRSYMARFTAKGKTAQASRKR